MVERLLSRHSPQRLPGRAAYNRPDAVLAGQICALLSTFVHAALLVRCHKIPVRSLEIKS